MTRIGAYQAKVNFSKLLKEVETTQREIIIQRRGQDVAALVPYQDLVIRSQRIRMELVLYGLAQIRSAQKASAIDIKQLITQRWNP